jgi:molecular chaperone DnaK
VKALGIDLGTTNCAAAYTDGAGIPHSVVNFEGDPLTPSAILLENEHRILVGREAVKLATRSPEAFAECFKRELGHESGPITILGQTFRPEFLSAALLLRLKRDFERTLGSAQAAVITVPAYFDDSRRRATQHAGRIAGWIVSDIINEPTAAALAFAHRHDALSARGERARRLLVYDLGGGTFDCTLLEITPRREYRTLATDGEVRLGGVDWDQRLAQHLAELFEQRTGVRLQDSPGTRAVLLRQARQLKHALSTRKTADAPLNLQGCRALLEVSRETFHSLTKDLLERTRHTMRLVLDAAQCVWKGVDALVLVGGSSRMPMVADMLRAESGLEPDLDPSIDVAVAHGAALYAHLLATKNPIRVVNVNAHSLRIVGQKNNQRVTSLIIPRNSPLPIARTKLYALARPDQTSVVIDVCEGDCEDPELCELIGTVKVSDLPPTFGQPSKIAVTLRFCADGQVDVSAAVVNPNDVSHVLKSVTATLIPAQGLTEEQIAAQRRRLARYQII